MAKAEIVCAKSEAEHAQVRALFEDYLSLLVNTYKIGGGCGENSTDLSGFPEEYQALFLARLDGHAAGACGLNHINGQDCEFVKLYVDPKARGEKLGQKLLEAVYEYARNSGYRRLVLSTEPVMTHAIALYKSFGFSEIDNYAHAPSACRHYMAMDLA